MAQGMAKGLKSKVPSGGRKKTGKTKKGKRDIAPKNAHLIKERQQHKVGCRSILFARNGAAVLERLKTRKHQSEYSADRSLPPATVEQDQWLDREADDIYCFCWKIIHHEGSRRD